MCAVGSFATGNNLALVFTVACFGLIGYFMDKNGYPVAALVLGAVMGTMVEQNFVTSLIKSDGSILPFFSRPVAAVLAAMTIAALDVASVCLAAPQDGRQPARQRVRPEAAFPAADACSASASDLGHGLVHAHRCAACPFAR